MYVLVPDDPVFFAKYQSLEEPLLRHLHRLHGTGPESAAERIGSDAYDSWVRLLLKLPLWSTWHDADASAGSAPVGYTLRGAAGNRLTRLYPIDVPAVDLGHLAACFDLFRTADGTRSGASDRADTAAPAGRPGRRHGTTDVFRRVMEVLLLPPPRRLLAVLCQAVTAGRAVPVTLPAEEEAEYRRHCEDIVTILSSGDPFAHRAHRALYL